jgi:hypothetical protein
MCVIMVVINSLCEDDYVSWMIVFWGWVSIWLLSILKFVIKKMYMLFITSLCVLNARRRTL